MQNKTARLISAYIFIFIAAFGIYAKTINYKLTYLDDMDFIRLCAQAYETRSFTDAFKNNVLFSVNNTPYYRPVLNLSFMLDNRIAGASVKFAHISNILLHCFCALLLFFFLRRYIIKDQLELSFLFTLFFAFSPAAPYTAAWIPGRNDSLFLLTFVLSLIFFIEYLNTRKIYLLIPHLFFMLAAFFTKESGIIIPFIIIAYRFTQNNGRKHNYVDAVLYLAYAASIFVFLNARSPVIPNSGLSFSMLSFSKGNLVMFFDYFYSIVFLRNSFAANFNAEILIFGAISICFAAFAAFYKKPKEEFLSSLFYFSLPFIFIAVTVLSGRIHSHGNRIYIPLFFASVIFASFAQTLIKNGKDAKTVCVCVIALILAAGAQTLKTQKYFDGLNFFDKIIEESDEPSNAIYKLRSSYLIDEGYLREALNDAVFMAYLSNFNDDEILYMLAYSFLLNGDIKNAEKYSEKLIFKNPNAHPSAWAMHLIAINFSGDKEKEAQAFSAFCQLYNLTHEDAERYINEGYTFLKEKKKNEVLIIKNDKRSRLNLTNMYLN